MTCPIPPTVIPSVGEGETGASVVQVPCPYAACPAVKVPRAPATIAKNHFLRVQKRSNIFLSSFRSYWFVRELLWKAPAEATRALRAPYTETDLHARGASQFSFMSR